MNTNDILESVLEASGVSYSDFRNSRIRMACFARMSYVKLRRGMGAKVEEIGKEINRDHSTVSHIEGVHDRDVTHYPNYTIFFEKVKRILEWKTAKVTTN